MKEWTNGGGEGAWPCWNPKLMFMNAKEEVQTSVGTQEIFRYSVFISLSPPPSLSSLLVSPNRLNSFNQSSTSVHGTHDLLVLQRARARS